MQTNDLDDASRDMLQEIFNIGIGDAAAALAKLVRDYVIIKVPEVFLIEAREVTAFVEQEAGSVGVYISQDFEGLIGGRTILFYSRECALSLIQTLTGKPSDIAGLSLPAMAILQEIGNIIMVSCISTISNFLKTEIRYQMPRVSETISETYFKGLLEEVQHLEKAVVVKNEMRIRDRDIQGYLFILFNFTDFHAFTQQLKGLLQRPRNKGN